MGGAFATINKGLTVMTIIRDLRLLHPKFGRAAGLLHQDLIRAYEAGETKTLFKVFETFRDPRRQLDALKKGVSKAGMYQSAHAFGMAADFVPFISPYEARTLSDELGYIVHPGWSWHASHDYGFLKTRAEHFGLRVPIAWDLVHVQHPQFDSLLTAMNKMKQI